ncbi:reverse transcriptase N-terminal domain-containing protein [Paraburkholderia susongensis]
MSWHSVNSRTTHAAVKRMQVCIVKATQDGRWNKVKVPQRLLTTSV